MKKTTKAKQPKPPATKALAAPEPKTLAIPPVHSEHYKAALAFRDSAAHIVISDKATHEGALRETKDGKNLRGRVLDYWKPIKQRIDAVKKAVLDLEKDEIGTVDAGLVPLERRIVEWVTADNARVLAEETAAREKADAQARADRERELQAQEDAAAKLEAESPNLSARELWFVNKVFEEAIDLQSMVIGHLNSMVKICKQAGYADPIAAVARLKKLPKIVTAIANMREVKAKRDQAAALREQPITVAAPTIERKVAKVAGTRMTKQYSCGGVPDLARLRAAYKAGELPDEAFEPNMVHLNRAAEDLTDKFEQAYPGARLKIKEGVAG